MAVELCLKEQQCLVRQRRGEIGARRKSKEGKDREDRVAVETRGPS